MERFEVNPELVRHIAKLASLELDKSDEERFVVELNKVLGYMKQLSSLDTEHIEATFQTFRMHNVTRKDEIKPSLPTEKILQNAPEKESIFFKIPPILEGSA